MACRRLALLIAVADSFITRAVTTMDPQRMEYSRSLFVVMRQYGPPYDPGKPLETQPAWEEHRVFMNAAGGARDCVACWTVGRPRGCAAGVPGGQRRRGSCASGDRSLDPIWHSNDDADGALGPAPGARGLRHPDDVALGTRYQIKTVILPVLASVAAAVGDDPTSTTRERPQRGPRPVRADRADRGLGYRRGGPSQPNASSPDQYRGRGGRGSREAGEGAVPRAAPA